MPASEGSLGLADFFVNALQGYNQASAARTQAASDKSDLAAQMAQKDKFETQDNATTLEAARIGAGSRQAVATTAAQAKDYAASLPAKQMASDPKLEVIKAAHDIMVSNKGMDYGMAMQMAMKQVSGTYGVQFPGQHPVGNRPGPSNNDQVQTGIEGQMSQLAPNAQSAGGTPSQAGPGPQSPAPGPQNGLGQSGAVPRPDSNGKITVKNSKGQVGKIPASQWKDAQAAGYILVQ